MLQNSLFSNFFYSIYDFVQFKMLIFLIHFFPLTPCSYFSFIQNTNDIKLTILHPFSHWSGSMHGSINATIFFSFIRSGSENYSESLRRYYFLLPSFKNLAHIFQIAKTEWHYLYTCHFLWNQVCICFAVGYCFL